MYGVQEEEEEEDEELVVPSVREPTRQVNYSKAGLRIRNTFMRIRIRDPSFHLSAKPDRTFHFNAYPDLALRQCDANLRPLVYRPSRSPF